MSPQTRSSVSEKLGIIFLDEIDKIAGERGQGGGPYVSREGVHARSPPDRRRLQRPDTYGLVKTDHVLFSRPAAFHVSKPSDLIPELQAASHIRVELKRLTRPTSSDHDRPENALTKQYAALIEAEKAQISFSETASRDRPRRRAGWNERM